MIDLDIGINLKTKESFVILRGDKNITDWALLLKNHIKEFGLDFIIHWRCLREYIK
jgi:hypothetical protein